MMRTLRNIIASAYISAAGVMGVSACTDIGVDYESPNVPGWDAGSDGDTDADSDADTDSDSDTVIDTDTVTDSENPPVFFDCELTPISKEIYPDLQCNEYDATSPVAVGATDLAAYGSLIGDFADAVEDNCGYSPNNFLPDNVYMEECATDVNYDCADHLTIMSTCGDALAQKFFGDEEACIGHLNTNSVSGDKLQSCIDNYAGHCTNDALYDCDGQLVHLMIGRDMDMLEDVVLNSTMQLDAYHEESDTDGPDAGY